ncbi:MAG: TlpA disulfide reductase family protein [Bryobacteraceae bacterium]|nr:TlpA disulfide reductase family protein [Bryobacteraceae bacterium]
MSRSAFAFVLPAVAMAGPAMLAAVPGCTAPAALQREFNTIEAGSPPFAARLEELTRKYPADFFAWQAWADQARWPSSQQAAGLEVVARKAAEAPDQPEARYLHGLLLIGRNTPLARNEFTKALELAPDFAWPHIGLAQIYSYPNFKDPKLLLAHLDRFLERCPEHLPAYGLFRNVSGGASLVAHAARLRGLLERRTDPRALASYPNLWSLEFKALPATEHSAVRERVRTDLGRLESVTDENRRALLMAMRDGYELLGDQAAMARINAELMPPAAEAMKLWGGANPRPQAGADLEARQRQWDDQRLAAARGWVAQWPEHEATQSELVAAMDRHPSVDNDEFANAAERLLDLQRRTPLIRRFPLPQLRVADAYLRRGTQLERIPQLLEEARAAAARQRRPADDLFPRQNALYLEQDPLLEADRLATEYALRLKDAATARRALARLEGRLAAIDIGQTASGIERVFQGRWEARCSELRARTAVLEGKAPAEVRVDEERRRASAPPPPAIAGASWRTVGRALPDFALVELHSGRTWRLSDVRGKTALVNVWATWCGPCREELPHFQKLHDKLKGRNDVLLFTINVDESVGLVEPFVRRHGLTVPVLTAAKGYIDEFIPQGGIPRTWIIDAQGVLRQELVGYGSGETWEAQMLAALEKFIAPPPAPK